MTGASAVTGLLGFLFHSLHLHRVTAYTAVRNVRSVALLERIGMRREGHMQQSFWLDGGWQDEYLYRQPVVLPKGTKVKMESVHDNSSSNPATAHDAAARIPLFRRANLRKRYAADGGQA